MTRPAVGQVYRDPRAGDLAMIVSKHRHRDQLDGRYYPASVLHTQDGDTFTLFDITLEHYEFIGTFKRAGQTTREGGVDVRYRLDVPDDKPIHFTVWTPKGEKPLAPSAAVVSAWKRRYQPSTLAV